MTVRGGTALRGLVAIAVGVVGLFSSGPVVAQTSGEELSEATKTQIERGRQFYENGEYGKAAEALRAAVDRAPLAMLLYNLALAEWKAGNLDRARRAAEEASRKELPKETALRNEGRIAAFGVVAEAREHIAPAGANTVQQTAGEAGSRPDPPKRPEGKTSSGGGFGGLGWTGVGLSVGGAAGIATAIWYDQEVRSAVERMDEAESAGNTDRANEILRDEVRPLKRSGLIFLGLGSTLAATGATFVIVDGFTGSARSGRSARLSLQPMLLPESVARSGRFRLNLRLALP